MSVGKKSIGYIALAAAVAAVIIAISVVLPFGHIAQPPQTQSVVAIQLTDPPQVPAGTQWLNLSYSSITVLYSTPSTSSSASGQSSISETTFTPSAGSATVDLMALENVSQTVATADVPSGATVYSVPFVVSSAKIDVNGQVSQVSLASGSNLQVTIAHPEPVQSGSSILLELNPVIVNATNGYTLIPSAVGIMSSCGSSDSCEIGAKTHVTNNEEGELNSARGSLSANITSFSVSGETTTFSVQVNNTGNTPVMLVAIGLHGSFTVAGAGCPSGSGEGDASQQGMGDGGHCEHPSEVVFVPAVVESSSSSTSITASPLTSAAGSSSSTSSSSSSTSGTGASGCITAQLRLVYGGEQGDNAENNVEGGGLNITPGQCYVLTFSGIISTGASGHVLIPNTSSGQSFEVHVIASAGAELQLGCSISNSLLMCPLSTSSLSIGLDN